MPKTRTRRPPPPLENDDDDDVVEAPPPPPADSQAEAVRKELSELFGDLPPTVRVKVWRVPEHGEREWCWTGEPSKATEENIAKFGPGEYLIVARGTTTADGSRRQVIKQTGRVRIAAVPESERPAPAAAPNGAAPGSLVDQIAQTALLQLLDNMQRSNREHSAAMVVLLEKIAKPDPILQTVLEKALGARGGDPLDQAARILDLTKARSDPQSSVAELIGTLDALDGIKARVRGRDDGGDGGGWASVFRDLGTAILARKSEHDAAPNAAPAALPAPAAGEAPTLTLERGQPDMPKIAPHFAALAEYFPDLVRAKKRGTAPTEVAAWLLANVPDDALDMTEQLLTRDTIVTEITTAEPQLADAGDYVDAVRKAALELLQQWADEGVDPNDVDDEPGDDESAA